MFFLLYEAERVKDADFLLQFIKEITVFLNEKGADMKLLNNAFSRQITFEENKFSFTMDVSIPLRK